jgi:hypothetical protein
MGTKNNPGKYDCYVAADPDEPIFTLRASDPEAPGLIRYWVHLRMRVPGYNGEKLAEAMRCAQAMEEWRAAHADT